MNIYYGPGRVEVINAKKCCKPKSLDVENVENTKWESWDKKINEEDIMFYKYDIKRKDGNYKFYFQYNEKWYYIEYNFANLLRDKFTTKEYKRQYFASK